MKIQKKLTISLGIALFISLASSLVLYGMKQPRTEEIGLDITQFPADVQSLIAQKFQQLKMENTIKFLANAPIIILEGHTGMINSVAINSNIVVTGSVDGTVKVWDATTGKQFIWYIDHNSPLNSVAINGDIIVTASIDGIVNISKTNGELLHTFRENFPILAVVISGNKLTSVLMRQLNDYLISIQDINTGKLLRIQEGGPNYSNVTISDNIILTGSISNNILRLWDIDTGKLLRTIENTKVDLAIIVGNKIVNAFNEGYVNLGPAKMTIIIQDINTGQPLHIISQPADGYIVSVTGSGDKVAIGSGRKGKGITQIWDVNTYQKLRAVEGLYGAISDDKVVTAKDNVAKVWSLDPFKGTPETNPLVWIINNATVPQADLIKRAHQATIAGQEFIIAFPSEDAKLFLSFPMHVKQYLLARLKIRR